MHGISSLHTTRVLVFRHCHCTLAKACIWEQKPPILFARQSAMSSGKFRLRPNGHGCHRRGLYANCAALMCYRVSEERRLVWQYRGVEIGIKNRWNNPVRAYGASHGRRPSIAAYHPLPLVSSMAILIFLLALSQWTALVLTVKLWLSQRGFLGNRLSSQ